MNDYPENWKEIAKAEKDRVNWRCEVCAHPHDVENGYMLTVHHLDGDKSNCSPENLLPCCQRCHLRVQAKYCPGQIVLFPENEPEWVKRRRIKE